MRLLEGVWLEDSQMECKCSSEPGLQNLGSRTWAPERNSRDEREREREREIERESLHPAKHPREVLILGLALSSGSASQGWQVTQGPLTRPTRV